MDLPVDVKDKIESLVEGYSLTRLKDIYQKIVERYTYKSGNGDVLVSLKDEVLVYAITRMPATYSSIYSVLLKTFESFPKEEIKSVLDIGAGMGSACIALSSFLNEDCQYTLIEREENMIDLGMSLTFEHPKLKKITWIKADFSKEEITKKADLVIASYSLNELNEKDRNKVVERLYRLANQLLIIVEPGTQIAFSELKKLRNKLIEQGGYVVSPCPHSSICQNEWCHFVTRVSRSKIHKLIKGGDAPYEDEKFSYLVISKTPVCTCENRILRHPIILNGNIILETCSLQGIQTIRIRKKDKELYKKAKKSGWGDSL